MSKPDPIDVLISFDTTGSMYPCLTQVRKNVSKLVKKLFKDIPNIRIGIIAHGDYCDAPPKGFYVTKMLDICDDKGKIVDFVKSVEPTFGGDFPECYELVLHEARCYELVLHEARSAAWSSGKNKVLVMIGDATPHAAHEAQNAKSLDWRNELELLLEAGISVYAVQALGRKYSTPFWQEVAIKTGGFHLELNQFAYVRDMIMAVCYKQQGNEQLEQFEQELVSAGKMTRGVDGIIGTMLGRTASGRFTSTVGALGGVPGGRFQVLEVDEDAAIKKFVLENGATFKTGRGFYEFTKRVKVQDYKEVILQDDATGDLFSGDKARQMAGIPIGDTANVSPGSLPGYTCFIQSTSHNRKLIAGTKFLYEVDDWEDE